MDELAPPGSEPVKNPGPHKVQAVAPSPLILLSLPHGEHVPLAPSLNDPAVHKLTALVPPHDDPAGHGEHDVRVIGVLPAVKDPELHDEQAPWAGAAE